MPKCYVQTDGGMRAAVLLLGDVRRDPDLSLVELYALCQGISALAGEMEEGTIATLACAAARMVSDLVSLVEDELPRTQTQQFRRLAEQVVGNGGGA